VLSPRFAEAVSPVSSRPQHNGSENGFRKTQPDVDLAAVRSAGALGHERISVGSRLGAGSASMPGGFVDVDFHRRGQADALATRGNDGGNFGEEGAPVFARIGFRVTIQHD